MNVNVTIVGGGGGGGGAAANNNSSGTWTPSIRPQQIEAAFLLNMV